MVHSSFFLARVILPFLPHPLYRPVRMYYVVAIFRDHELSACCIDIKYTRTLYVERFTHSVGPKVRFSADLTWYIRRTSVNVYVYVGIRTRS